MMFHFLVGVDLGQVNDYTGFVIIQRRETIEPEGLSIAEYKPEMHQDMSIVNNYELRHLERFPLGTSYPAIVARMREVMHAPELQAETIWIVDQTGVGRPVIEMMRREGIQPVIGVNITGGSDVTQSEDYTFNVPKRDLVSVLQLYLQSGRLKIASGLPNAEVLRDEILNFRVKLKAKTGEELFEAWRDGDHDDLVLATALGCWYAHNYDFKRRLADEGKAQDQGWDPLTWGLEG